MKSMIYDLTVVFVGYKTPELFEIVIKSFEKFKTKDFYLKFLIIENSQTNLSHLSKENVRIFNRNTDKINSDAHADALEYSKQFIDTEFIFTCHNDTCVTSTSFFDELKKCIEDDVVLAGVCEDKAEHRIRALHSSGLFVRSDLFKKTSLLPVYPKIDSTDLLTLRCRENGFKIRLFRNTYNDPSLVDICEPIMFRNFGKDCGMDRCLDSNDRVMFIHQGRGTPKYSNLYKNSAKISFSDWQKICKRILEDNL